MAIAEVRQPHIDALGSLLVRRALPHPLKKLVNPFIFMDQSGPTRLPKGTMRGVKEQPQAGLATFTYLLEGAVLHRDSADNEARIFAGDVALMTAGSGVTHKELPDPDDLTLAGSVYFVQMWLALPNAIEEMSPAFELHRHVNIPEAHCTDGTIWVLVGADWGETAPTTTYTDTIFADLVVQVGGIAPLA